MIEVIEVNFFLVIFDTKLAYIYYSINNAFPSM